MWLVNVAMMLLEAAAAICIAAIGMRRMDPKRRMPT